MTNNGSILSKEILVPTVRPNGNAWTVIASCVRELMKVGAEVLPNIDTVNKLRDKFLEDCKNCNGETQLARITVSILCDLRAQGWTFTRCQGGYRLVRPEALDASPEAEKIRVRAGHAIERDSQLRQPSVRQFIRSMERKRLGPAGWVSIFSLMRDGRELSAGLQNALEIKEESARTEKLQQLIQPYIQFVDGDRSMCPFTGFRLLDIWRYFRYTWASAYNSVPGRNIFVLVRDRAAPNHPIVGIGALASPVVHLTKRDEWIGWAPKQFVLELKNNPSADWAKWVWKSLNGLVGDIFVADFIKEKLIRRTDLMTPRQGCIEKLLAESARARLAHQRYPKKSILRKGFTDWKVKAQTHLFRAKRAEALADLLLTRRRLKEAGFKTPTKASLQRALESADGRQAVDTIRRYVKSIHAGNDMLDLSICGAVQPYNSILGGKLVAMLMTSPEVVQYYSGRYGEACSIIASSVAGKPIRRKPQLVLLTTTSLYGSELSQYTRLSIPVEVGGASGKESVRYEDLGSTEGQGSYHLSQRTVEEIEVALSQATGGRRINSIFGEGVNPRIRKIRAGLDLVGFPAEHVLEHGRPRVLYVVPLVSNLRDVLIGRCKKPIYLFPQEQPLEKSANIAGYWNRRWLLKRIEKPGIFDLVRLHTPVHPVTHGARVTLPPVGDEEGLFSTTNVTEQG